MANFKEMILPLITKKFNTRMTNSIPSLRHLTRNFGNTPILKSQEYYMVKSQNGENYRLHLAKSRHLVGIRTTRGIRELNEDRYQAMVLELPKNEIVQNYDQPALDKNLENEVEGKDNQICYFAIFDGHGGSKCADYLTANLHERIEVVEPSDADDVVTELRGVRGYFRRFKPASLEMLLSPEVADTTPKRMSSNQKSGRESLRQFSSSTPSLVVSITTQPFSPLNTSSTIPSPKSLTMEQRLTLAFLKADTELLNNSEYRSVGSTASVALIKSLDKRPFWTSNNIEITTAHVGDTRILLCEVEGGKSIPLTLDHRPNEVSEINRLSKSGGFIITDSFGAEMFLGTLANTRAFGDANLKRYGITAEPEISKHIVDGTKLAFMVLVSDGITSVLSNQEIVDQIKHYNDPTLGAAKLVDLADELGSDDNITAMVVRLPGWGSLMPDLTKELRQYRLDQNITSRRSR